MIIFDGNQFAQQKELKLKSRVTALHQQGKQIKIVAILFTEDASSRLYTRLKKEAAERIGIQYQVHSFSMAAPIEEIGDLLEKLNADQSITGIMIQKPAKQIWLDTTGKSADEFQMWWHQLVSQINEHKDVDGLHPHTLQHLQTGDWEKAGCVLPATAKAVLAILIEAPVKSHPKIIILGKSDILGQPLFFVLKNQGEDVEMIGSAELQAKIEKGMALRDADVIISATGRPNLITGDLLKEGCVVIDVGEPKPDVERESVAQKAAFLTPVPGGVGPVTIVSLLENAVEVAAK